MLGYASMNMVRFFARDADPIEAMMELLASGHACSIKYDKLDGKPCVSRLIIPKRLVDGPGGLLIQAYQIEPESGPRMFYADQIHGVESGRALTDAERKRTSFLTGEVVSYRVAKRTLNESAPAAGSETQPHAAAWRSDWFIAYFTAVRSAVLDGKVSRSEAVNLQGLRTRLQLTEAQVWATHAHIYAQELLAMSVDGAFDENDARSLASLRKCLTILGWPEE